MTNKLLVLLGALLLLQRVQAQESQAQASAADDNPPEVVTLSDDAAAVAEPYPTTIPIAPVEKPEPLPQLPDKEEAVRLDDVLVTATKRTKSTREVPASIDAFSGEDLIDRGATNLKEALKYSPGVTLGDGANEGNSQLTVRGVSGGANTTVYGQPTGFFYEDIGLTNPSLLGIVPEIDPFDLATVEVLKGPQGTLFGGSALSGAVRFTPNKPEFEEWHSVLALSGDRVADGGDSTGLAGMFNIPVGERLALRVAGNMRNTAGFVDDTRRGRKDDNRSRVRTLRGILGWRPWDWLNVEASYLSRSAKICCGSRINGDPADRQNSFRRGDDLGDYDVSLASLNLEGDLDFARLIGIVGLLRKDGLSIIDLSALIGDEDSPTTTTASYYLDTRQPSYELRLVSSQPTSGNFLLRDWDYLVGLFYSQSDQSAVAPVEVDLGGSGTPGAPTAVALRIILEAVATEKAVFFDLTRHLFDNRVELTVGGRYYDQLTEGNVHEAVGFNLIPGLETPGVQGLSDQTANLAEKGFNPKLSLAYKATRDISFYAAASRGFRFGGLNYVPSPLREANNVPLTFDSDEIWNYEVGVRTDWFERKLAADLSLFRVDWNNAQTQQLLYGGIGYVENLGGARNLGAEADIRALLPWGFQVKLTGAYIDARSTEAFESAEGPVPAGARMPATPYKTGAATMGWGAPIGPVLVSANYSTTYYGDAFSTLAHTYRIPSYTTHAANINLFMLGLNFKPSLNFAVTNLFDKSGFSTAYLGGTPRKKLIGYPLTPRTMSLTLSFSF